MPAYRDLWLRIRDDLPKKGRGQQKLAGEPNLPAPLEGALQSLYANYAKYYERWQANAEARADGLTPPVFIVVCNNTNVSKMVFDYIAGWEKQLANGESVAVPGKLPLFSNVEGDRFIAQPNTILVDSEQLESGEAMSAEFKQLAAREIEEFKADYRRRFPGRDADGLTDEDLLREVMNTVGKQGKLGEQIKCVVSRLDAHRGLGRQHGYAYSRRSGLRHAIALRASRRPRPAADELFAGARPDQNAVGHRRNRGLPGGVCRSLRRAVFVHLVFGRRRRSQAGAACRRTCGPWKIASTAKSLSRASTATATNCRPNA